MNDAPQPDPAASDVAGTDGMPPKGSVHPPDGKPSELALAEYDAGVSPEADAATIAAHVAGCPACQLVLAALRSVRDDVRRESAPMPAAVSRRLAEALAAAAGSSDPNLSTVDRQGRHRVPDVVEMAAARRVRRLRAAGAVAAGLIVLGGGGYLVTDQGHLGSGDDSAAGAVEDPGGGDSGADSGGEVGSAEGAALPVFDRQSLEAAAGDLLASSPLSTESAGGSTTEVDAGCLASLPVATGEVLSVTRVVYEGQPALVVLFPDAPARVQVTVLSDCGGEGEPRVLDQFTADR